MELSFSWVLTGQLYRSIVTFITENQLTVFSVAASSVGIRDWREQVSLPRCIEITGSAYERGKSYGDQAADLIRSSLLYYEAALGEQTGLTWEQVCVRASSWREICEQNAPEIMEELRGIAVGSGLTSADLLALNVRGELMYDEQLASKSDIDGCTSFALLPEATSDGHQYCGQNWDWRDGVRDTLAIVRVTRGDRPTIVMQVEAGQVGRHGVNSAGIALNANGLGGQFPHSPLGMPQTFIRRMVLDQDRPDGALAALVHSPTHIASNALLSVAGGFAINMETTPDELNWLYPDAGLLVHANHYQGPVPGAIRAEYRPSSVDSFFRLPRLRSLLADAARERPRQVIESALSDTFGYPESISTFPDDRMLDIQRWSTLLSSYVDLTTGDYLVASGPPAVNPYELVPWNVLDGPRPPAAPAVLHSHY